MASQRLSSRKGATQTLDSQSSQSQRSTINNPEIFRKVNQYLLNYGCVLRETLLKDTNGLLEKMNIPLLDQDGLSQLVNNLNKKLRPFNLMIRSCMDEISSSHYYVLISIIDSKVTHGATLYNEKQLEFFKLILQAIVQQPLGIIAEEDLADFAEKALLKKRSEHNGLFHEWTGKKWFVVITEGERHYVTLGVRAIAELDVFIKQKLVERPEDLTCKRCNNMSIYSALCAGCNDRYHKRCSKLAFEDSNMCRSCRRESQ